MLALFANLTRRVAINHPIQRAASCCAKLQPSDPEQEANFEGNLILITTQMTRGERSRAHVLILEALNAPIGRAKCKEEAASAAMAEALAFFCDGVRFSLGELFALSDAVIFYRDQRCPTPAASYNLESLDEIVGDRDMARLGISLCGAMFDPETRSWRDGPGQATRIVFGDDFSWRQGVPSS